MKTSNRFNTFIAVARDCPTITARTPPSREPKSAAQLEFEMLIGQPYRFTSDEVLYAVHGQRRAIARADFFAKARPDFRVSPLTQRYGWGVHFDENGRIALHALGSAGYEELAGDPSLTQLEAYRSKRRRRQSIGG